jgi:hypothetical protein
MPVERSRSYRGISVRAALGYLENVGGERVGDERVEGDGWTATLSSETVEVGPSIRLTEVTVEFEGEDAELLDPIIEKFSQKAIRAGG